MGYTLDIVHAGGTFTLSENFNFDFRWSKQPNGRNAVDFIDLYLDVSAVIVASSPSAVVDDMKAAFDVIALRLQPVTVIIKLDGTEKWKFEPSTSDGGPTIVEASNPREEGNAGSKWSYDFTVFVRLPGNNFAGLYELRTSLTEVTNPAGVVVQKIWDAVGKAKTIKAAVDGVMLFKPAGDVYQKISRSFDPDPVASATWMWRRTTLRHSEDILIIGGPKGYEIDPQAGVNVAPLLHLARRGAIIARVDGVVTGLQGDNVVAPKPHWKDSSTMTRATDMETNGQPTIRNDDENDQGFISRRYNEVWICTGEQVPDADHTGHGPERIVEVAPADGAMAR